MNVFGIGGLELLVILLVAFVALGPGRTVEVARTIGRMAREARRTFSDIMDAASLSDADAATRRDQTSSNQGAAGSPTQPPSDPLPMPSHLRQSADELTARSDETDPAPPTSQR